MIFLLLGGFVGGLLLNLMPCILPVLSLKILNFIKLGKDNGKWGILKHSLTYSAGVVLSFIGLAGFIIIVQILGGLAGWGFQFQSTWFCATMAGLMLLMGLNTLDVFKRFSTLGLFSKYLSPIYTFFQGKGGYISTFSQGILTTLIGSACCGPFLGSTIGLALTLPLSQALVIFTAIGIGMASPYLLLGAFPKLIKKLPKPGPWMNWMKIGMGVLMLATSAWFIWILI